MLKTKEYKPKTANGKAAKNKRNEKKRPVRIAECSCSFSDGSTVRVVVEKRRKEHGYRRETSFFYSWRNFLVHIPHKKSLIYTRMDMGEYLAINTSPEQIIEDYGNRWFIETLFEEAKGEWYINKLPSRDLEAIKVHFYFRFIAYNIASIFKRALAEKYRKAGIEVLRRNIIHKIAVISFNSKSIKFEFNRKYKIRYNEQLAGIKDFISRTKDKIKFIINITFRICEIFVLGRVFMNESFTTFARSDSYTLILAGSLLSFSFPSINISLFNKLFGRMDFWEF